MPPDDSIDILRVLARLWAWRRFILTSALAAGLVAAAVTFLLPDMYRARATALSAHRAGSLQRSAAQFAKEYLPLELFEKSKPVDILSQSLEILESRTAMETVAREFDLPRVYGARDGSMERAIEMLRRNTVIELTRKDALTVTVYDTDPVRAARMANAFIRILRDVTRDANARQARNARLFLERRSMQADSAMRAIERALSRYQARHGIYALPLQATMALDEAAHLQAAASAADIELGILERAFGAGAPQAATKRVEREAYDAERRRLKFGAAEADSAVASMQYPFAAAPAVGMGYARLAREYRIQSNLLIQVSGLLEKAKLDEHRNALPIVALDRAVPAEERDSPKRLLIGIAFALAALFLSSALALRLDGRQARVSPAGARVRKSPALP
ncbi:MAG: hypothetical protein IPP94_14425 [Ignavibacteria bacterium]|nr:hypothetical protein [Ignavibacteria bacterium]